MKFSYKVVLGYRNLNRIGFSRYIYSLLLFSFPCRYCLLPFQFITTLIIVRQLFLILVCMLFSIFFIILTITVNILPTMLSLMILRFLLSYSFIRDITCAYDVLFLNLKIITPVCPGFIKFTNQQPNNHQITDLYN